MNHRFKQKVSPGVEALGVEAVFPGLRSPAVEAPRIRQLPTAKADGLVPGATDNVPPASETFGRLTTALRPMLTAAL